MKIRSNSGDGERHRASTNHRSIPAVRSKASASTEVASCHRCINKELPTTRAAADRIASSVSSDSCGEWPKDVCSAREMCSQLFQCHPHEEKTREMLRCDGLKSKSPHLPHRWRHRSLVNQLFLWTAGRIASGFVMFLRWMHWTGWTCHHLYTMQQFIALFWSDAHLSELRVALRAGRIPDPHGRTAPRRVPMWEDNQSSTECRTAEENRWSLGPSQTHLPQKSLELCQWPYSPPWLANLKIMKLEKTNRTAILWHEYFDPFLEKSEIRSRSLGPTTVYRSVLWRDQ